MHTRALEAKDIAKTNTRPLWIFHATITANAIARQSLDNRLVSRRHLNHLGVDIGQEHGRNGSRDEEQWAGLLVAMAARGSLPLKDR